MRKRVSGIIREYRNRIIQGNFINLVPLSEKDIKNVVKIRNQEKNRYFLNQTFILSVEDQLRWYESYLERDNDIYWCIYSKDNIFIGTVRIYDIDEESDLCDQGSFMIDADYSESAPYALEAEILSLDFVFDILKIGNVINEDKADNKVMNNLTKKIGFEFKKNTLINNVDYKYYLLTPMHYRENRHKFADIISYWKERG